MSNTVVTKIIPNYTAKVEIVDGTVRAVLEYDGGSVTVTCPHSSVISGMVMLENFAGIVLDEYAKVRASDDNSSGDI